MRSSGIKSLTAIALLAFAIVFGSAAETHAQSRRDIERERHRIEKQQQKIARQNARLERERQERYRRQQPHGYRDGGAYNEGLSRRSVNATLYQGYQQGLIAGQSDRIARKYNRFNVYRNTGSAPNDGDPTSRDYLYRQGYLEGYEDGFHGRLRY